MPDDKPKPMTMREAMERLNDMIQADSVIGYPEEDGFTLEVARALDYSGYIEFRSRMGKWHSPLSSHGSIDGDIADLWDRGMPIRLSERGRGRLATFRVPLE
jgi:hypothetical protein